MKADGRGLGLARTPLRDTDPSWVGAYRLQARLGAGGMGVVYLAAAQDGRPVALKVLRPEMAGDAEFRKRFSREVTALHRVQGVCTVRVIDADTTADQPYLVTEYAEGPSLAEYVESRGPMDPQMLYGLATGLAEALTAIHTAGRPQGHRHRRRPGAGCHRRHPGRHDGRLGRLYGPGADHGPGRHRGRPVQLGRHHRPRGQRAAPLRHRSLRGHPVPDPARGA